MVLFQSFISFELLELWYCGCGLQVRTFAQLGYAALLDQYPLQEWPGWQEGLGVGGCEVAAQVLRFMVENIEFQVGLSSRL